MTGTNQIVLEAFKLTSLLLMIDWWSSSAAAQVYPKWFLDQGMLDCLESTVGYANASFYDSSAIAEAKQTGEETWAKNKWTRVDGNETYWVTELGTSWIRSSFWEEYDPTIVANAATFLRPVDTARAAGTTILLMSSPECTVNQELRRPIAVGRDSVPSWVESPPSSPFYHYAVGIAPQYHYESSSWLEAESVARRNIARIVCVTLQALQKKAYESEEVRQEKISVEIKGVQTVARWRDPVTSIFFVLVRMPI